MNPYSEFKWVKVSHLYLDKYKSLMDWFFSHLDSNYFRLRAHVVDTGKSAYREYGEGDLETSFYKVYYHLLYQSIKHLIIQGERNGVIVLTDDRWDRYRYRLNVLKKALNSAIKRDYNISRLVRNIEPRQSNGPLGEPLIQIVDVIIGAIGFVRNGRIDFKDSSQVKK